MTTTAFKEISSAVVKQAVRDWRNASDKLRKRPGDMEAESMIIDCERFFLSPWFTVLTDADGRAVLSSLRSEGGKAND